MIKYVLGFLFSRDRKRLVLIKKEHPSWQKGLYNGVGGKIKINETKLHAMCREFEEETGLVVEMWREFAIIHGTSNGEDYTVYCFYTVFSGIEYAQTKTDEVVEVIDVDLLDNYTVIPNLKWLIPMALDPYHRSAEITTV